MPPAADALQSHTEASEIPAGNMRDENTSPQDAPNRNAPNGGGAPDAAKRITELRVSANLMTLDTGIFCVFPSPGSPVPDPLTGLPGVRVTVCPGLAGRPDAVSISTFRDDGWLDNTAALVRVTDGPAQVLVTIYQAAGPGAELAPRLQVLRLSSDGMAPQPEMPAAAPAGREPDVMAHVQATGDVPGQFGDWIGKRGSRAWIEGFGVTDKGPIAAGDMEYQGVLGRGWLSPWVDNGKFCGSRGMALPLLGLNVRLKGEAANQYTARYSATFVDGSAVGPIEEGNSCESPGLAALESFLIELVPKTGAASADRSGTGRAATRATAPRAPIRPGRR